MVDKGGVLMCEDKRLSEVIRVRKRPHNFVMMDKTFLEDDRLSYKAKGILAYLLSKPDNWKVIVGNLVNHSTDGKSSVYAGLKELKECGYYEKKPIRNGEGTRITRWESTVYEIPNSLLTNYQDIDNIDIENQLLENHECNNNNATKKLIVSNNQVKSCQQRADEPLLESYLSLLKENICYHDLQAAYSTDDMTLIDEFITIALDAILSDSDNIRINGQNKPRDLVRSNLLKLRYNNIVHVLEQFKKQRQQIQKKPQYILSMLYHSPMEFNAHYSNLRLSDQSIGKL